MTEHVEVAIIGGGVMGAATAYFLAEDPCFSGRIAVLEKDPTFASGASSRSTSGFRQQFSTAVNIEMARFSADFITHADLHLSVDGQGAGVPVCEAGYLYLGGPRQAEAFAANNALQRAHGVDVALLDPVELARRFPWLILDDVAVGSLGLGGEGWLDGYLLMTGFRRRAQQGGAAYRYREVVALRTGPAGGYELVLDDGALLLADQVVNVAGADAPALAAQLGVHLPVARLKQSVFSFSSPFRAPAMPYVFTPDGLFFRPEGADYIAGMAIAANQAPCHAADLELDHALFDEEVWPRLARRAQGFEEARFKGGWAGCYDMSLYDHNPFIGLVEGLPGYVMATGFSGHGLMQSPAVGRALAELVACRA